MRWRGLAPVPLQRLARVAERGAQGRALVELGAGRRARRVGAGGPRGPRPRDRARIARASARSASVYSAKSFSRSSSTSSPPPGAARPSPGRAGPPASGPRARQDRGGDRVDQRRRCDEAVALAQRAHAARRKRTRSLRPAHSVAAARAAPARGSPNPPPPAPDGLRAARRRRRAPRRPHRGGQRRQAQRHPRPTTSGPASDTLQHPPLAHPLEVLADLQRRAQGPVEVRGRRAR